MAIEIRTLKQLNDIREALGEEYTLMNDIDASWTNPENLDYINEHSHEIEYEINTHVKVLLPGATVFIYKCIKEGNFGKGYQDTEFWEEIWYFYSEEPDHTTAGWLPIGTDLIRFTGIFDGNHYQIKNLYTNMPEMSNVGLFGAAKGAINFSSSILRNIIMVSPVITGKTFVGGIIGNLGRPFQTHGRIESCAVLNCSITGAVSVGGVCGYINSSGSMFLGNYSSGIVTSRINEALEGGDTAGGCIGRIQSSSALVSNSFSSCRAIAETTACGGFVGYSLSPNIINCFSYGACDISGEIGETTLIGGFSGYNPDPPLSSCYYNSETSGQSNNDGRGIPKTTAEMHTQSTYTNWDFDTIWSINSYNDRYPWLLIFGKYFFESEIIDDLILRRNSFDTGNNKFNGNTIFTLPVVSRKNSVAFLISLS